MPTELLSIGLDMFYISYNALLVSLIIAGLVARSPAGYHQ
jgi:hypothetical protein